MKNLLSKEHYCYKIYALLTKSSVYPPPIDNLQYGLPPTPPPPHFYKKISIPTITWFFKILDPSVNKARFTVWVP